MKLENKINLKGVSKKQQPKYTRVSLKTRYLGCENNISFEKNYETQFHTNTKQKDETKKKSEKKQIKRPYKPR
jgi:hypothetical protein